MERIIDFSNNDGYLWVEDENYQSDFIKEPGYLFSVAISYNIRGAECRLFHKDYPRYKNPFKGKYYITIPHSYAAELHATKDYNEYISYNITDTYWGAEISDEYQDTLIVDMDAMTASCKDEYRHFNIIIKETIDEVQARHSLENNGAWRNL